MRVSINKVWPQTRIDRASAVKSAAMSIGIRMSIKQYGSNTAPLFMLVFDRKDGPSRTFCDVAEAEQWVSSIKERSH